MKKVMMVSSIIVMVGTTFVSAQVAVNSDGSIKVGDLDKAQNVTGNSLDIAVNKVYIYPTANKSASFTIYNNTENNQVIIGGGTTLSAEKAQTSAFNNRFNRPTYIEPTTAGGLCIGTSTKALGTIYAGAVYSAGQQLTSDRRVKKNIRSLENVRGYLLSLRPVRFDFNTELLPLSEQQATDRIGFIAQEVKEVLPEAVGYDTLADLHSLDYVSLIPLLTKGFQEQDSVIRAQQALLESYAALVEELAERIDNLQDMMVSDRPAAAPKRNPSVGEKNRISVNALYQNEPNPFNGDTRIGYELSKEVRNAQIVLYSMNGEQLKVYELPLQTKGELVLGSGNLKAGIYLYGLVVDGVQVDLKRMVLMK